MSRTGRDEENEVGTVGELILHLEGMAEPYPYLSDFDILVIEESSKPILIMNLEEFRRFEDSVIGT